MRTEELFAPVDLRDRFLEDDNVTTFLEELVEECWVTGNFLQDDVEDEEG